MKSSDISVREILELVDRFHRGEGSPPDVALRGRFPEKVVLAKMDKLADRGLIEVGVSLRTGWLSEAGRKELARLQGEG